MTRTAPLVAATLVAMAGVLAARQTSQFSAGVDLVEVDVSVFDKGGHPITDLTARDFEVLEDGQPQTIQAIYLATLDRTILRAVPAAQAAPEATTAPAAVLERRELKQRVFIFLLDMNHLSADGFTRSRDAITGFIKDGMTPADLVGVVVGDKMVGNRIGSDKDALLKALADVKGPNLSRYAEMRTFPRIIDDVEAAKIARNDERTIDVATERACREQPGECSGGRGGSEGMVRQQVESKGQRIAAETQRDTSLALTTLESLANGLGRLPGPKQVAIFSDGFYTDDTSAWLKSVVGIAARNGVRFSTFDARGIGKNPQQQNFLDAAPVTSWGDLTSITTDANADVLTSLALDTGGERFFNYNNFREPLDKLARETSTYYVLGYRPAKAFDGSYRRLEVKLVRPAPDVLVRYRHAYLAARGAPAPASTAGTGPGASAAAATAPNTSAAPEASHTLPVGPPATPLVVAAGRSGIGASAAGDDASPRGRPDSVDLVSTLAKSRMGTGSTSADEANRIALDGWQLYAKGHVEEARDRLARAASQAPGMNWIQYALGQAEFTLQHFDPAIAAFERVRKALPDYEPVYFDLADSYLQHGQPGEALAVLRDAERRWPNDSETHNAVGCVLMRRQAFDDAASAFERAIQAAPADGLGYFNLARAYHFTYLRVVRSSSASATATSMLADRNRQRTIEAYKKYLTIGGPFEKEAREAIAGLDWK
ncbi:MAG TPA: VWA domain-containing protein [Vicinamibacterales bacterium]|nr:VWA domain-containing protein [Vicinamibacterales bacterium]